jgi:hypothetical protein
LRASRKSSLDVTLRVAPSSSRAGDGRGLRTAVRPVPSLFPEAGRPSWSLRPFGRIIPAKVEKREFLNTAVGIAEGETIRPRSSSISAGGPGRERSGGPSRTALILGLDPSENTVTMPFNLGPGEEQGFQIEATLSFTGIEGAGEPVMVPGWESRLLSTEAMLAGEALVLEISPERDLTPGRDWSWSELGGSVHSRATDGRDPYTFGHMFAQQVHVEINLHREGNSLSYAEDDLLVCDTRRLGTLYSRLIEDLLAPDVERQASRSFSGSREATLALHPLYPVALIAADKAARYKRALIEDIVYRHTNLIDPGWLLRVGLYLEFLTFLGMVEAVKDEVGDLLTPAEREAFEHGESFGRLRERINPSGWRDIWSLREISWPQRGIAGPGSGSVRNLLRKRRATLGFLQVHHDDLKHAIELAGANHSDSQQTWQRVFRDAELSVLRTVHDGFPELRSLPAQVRELVLWHRRGEILQGGSLRVPASLSAMIGDRDGLLVSAAVHYRRSMNSVAAWAKGRELMGYVGDECIPRELSLLEAGVERASEAALLATQAGIDDPERKGV